MFVEWDRLSADQNGNVHRHQQKCVSDGRVVLDYSDTTKVGTRAHGILDVPVHQPHLIGVVSGSVPYRSLAEWLKDRNGGKKDGTKRTARVVGLEKVNGEPSVKIEIVVIDQRPVPNQADAPKPFFYKAYLWLATKKNYLPIRHVEYWGSYSTKHPTNISTVASYGKVAPGIFYPRRVVTERWFLGSGNSPRRLREPALSVIEVAALKLNPEVAEDVFEFDFPEGTLVFIVHNGVHSETIDYYVPKAQTTPRRPDGKDGG